MKSREALRPAASTAAFAAALAFCVAGVGQAVAAPPTPASDAAPAFMFLDLPAAGARAAVELPVVSFTYDAEAGTPIRRRGSATTDDENVRVTMVLAKTDSPIPIVAKTAYESFQLVETDATKVAIKRLTFHTVAIESSGPDGDEPSVRVTFTARTVTAT
jgi:hypothetical protein